MQSFDGLQHGVRRCQQLQGILSTRRRSRYCLLRRVNGGLSLIQHGLLESLDCPATHNISFIITIFIITIIYRCKLPFSCVYYISPLLYNDSESGSGDTQSSSCRASQLRAHAPSILHPVLHPTPSYNSYTTSAIVYT